MDFLPDKRNIEYLNTRYVLFLVTTTTNNILYFPLPRITRKVITATRGVFNTD
jgi:hypothetical protein